MALLAASTIEVRPGAGSDTNGGGASTVAASNLSLQNSAAYAQTDIVTNGTTTITSALSNWGTDVADNWIYLAGGSGSVAANWYRIVTRVSASILTLDRSTGLTAGTGVTGNVGGALASIGGLGALLAGAGVSGMQVWVKAGTDTLTSSTANVSGGKYSNASFDILLAGYNSTRGDLNNSIGSASRPVIHAGAITSITLVTEHLGSRLANIVVNGNSGASNVGFSGATTSNCTAQNCVTGLTGSAGHVNSSALTCGTGFSGIAFVGCCAKGCTTSGITTSANNGVIVGCVLIDNQIGISSANNIAGIVNNTVHGSTGDGMTGLAPASLILNNVVTDNGGDGIDFTNTTTAPTTSLIVNNATRGNGTVYETTPPTANIAGAIVLSGDPYTSEATDDLSPNNTAGAGASLRNAGVDAYGQTDNRDVGAVQHADPSGSTNPIGQIVKVASIGTY